MSILIGIIIIGVVIIFHEFGHFILAKKNGITVTEFSVGMGPRIASFKKGETRYSLKIFPIGGSCMMLGEDESSEDGKAFNNKGVWARISVILAGPIFNFVLAFLLSLIMVSIMGYDPARVTTTQNSTEHGTDKIMEGDIITEVNGKNITFAREIDNYMAFHPLKENTPVILKFERDGKKYETSVMPVKVTTFLMGFLYNPDTTYAELNEVVENSASAAAGLKAGDIVKEIDGTKINTGAELASYIRENPLSDEKAVEVVYERNGITNQVSITPQKKEALSLGVSYNTYYEKTNVFGVIKYSVAEVKYWISTVVSSLGQLISGKVKSEDLGGPVRIVSELGNTVSATKEYGFLTVFVNLLNWAVLLSANLGVMNLLPIPALDGGRLLFLLIEVFRGKPIDREKEGFVNVVGFILLMILMVFVFFNDIRNVFFR